MVNPTKVFISPDRRNLRFSVIKTSKDKMHRKLDWLVTIIKDMGHFMPKTIIFCNTLTDIAFVFNYLLFTLERFAYYPQNSIKKENLIIGIFHSLSWLQNKDRIFSSF